LSPIRAKGVGFAATDTLLIICVSMLSVPLSPSMPSALGPTPLRLPKSRVSGPIDAGPDKWYLGRIRNLGSIHADYWRGAAAELAQRSAIGIYPIGGWWKENPAHHRYDRTVRYALIVSIRAVNGIVDIYTPVSTQITAAVQVQT
jgi:hypothetical protein